MGLVSLGIDMVLRNNKSLMLAGLAAGCLLLAEPAAAFRCGNKLVKDGMHEAEVVAICGEPTSVRRLGYAIRSVDVRRHQLAPSGWTISRHSGYYSYPAEVMITDTCTTWALASSCAGWCSRVASCARSKRWAVATSTNDADKALKQQVDCALAH